MAHFAEIDKDNKVVRVLVVDNSEEHRGQDFLANDLGLGGTWIQTSYNGKIRKNYAGVGYKYDADLDAFIPTQPFASWVLDEKTAQWKAPIDMPTDGKRYSWDEDTTSWIEVTE